MSRRPRAFTLVEILVAVALLGLLLVAMNTFIFSMGEIWGRGAEERLFDQHVRAVTRHVEKILRTAACSPQVLGDPTASALAREIQNNTGARENLLSFELPAGDRLLAWPGAPLPDVVCALGVQNGAGLVLYWHSRLEEDFEDQPPRTAVLSPFGTALGFDYYQADFKSWRREPALMKDREGKWLLPNRVMLRFAHGKMTRETSITLPVPVEGLPIF